VCFDNFDPSDEYATLTLTGGGGFGKTTLVVALCDHQDVKDIFINGVVFVDLGPQPCNPISKLNDLYCKMTKRSLECGTIDYVEEKIKRLTKKYNKLLVIIDDVWETDDAKVILRAFSNCKTIITTRITNISIPSHESVDVGPMTLTEAIKVMTSGVIEYGPLPQESKKLLDDLARNAHQWPLLLSLIRGQLKHNCVTMSTYAAIQSAHSDLLSKGLVAFDGESVKKSRQYSAQACIELSLEKLDKSTENKLKSVILFTGIGGSLPKGVLHCLWSVSVPDARKIASDLEKYGLVSNISIAMPPYYFSAQTYLTIHPVISKHLLGTINSNEVAKLSPFVVNTEEFIVAETELAFKQYFGEKIYGLSKLEFLIYNKQKLEHVVLPYYVKDINQHVLHDPHLVILMLQNVLSLLTTSSHILQLFNKQILDLISECQAALSHGELLSRKYNTHFQLCCSKMKFDNLATTLAQYQESPFFNSVLTSCIELTKTIASCCVGKLHDDLVEIVTDMRRLTKDYHTVPSEKLHQLKLSTKLHSEISIALQKKCFDEISRIYSYLDSGQFEKDVDLVRINYAIRVQSLDESPKVRT